MSKAIAYHFLGTLISLASVIPSVTPRQPDTPRRQEWFLDFLDVERVHKLSTGAGVTVALPDTGIFNHQDFTKNITAGPDLIAGKEDVVNNDRDGHGTEMAGLIVGHGHGQGKGILGIAPAARLIPIKVTEGGASISKLDKGIELAATLGARVINVSAATGPSLSLQKAVALAADHDAVVVAGSGNNFSNSQMGYPASLPGVLAVGAIDQNGDHAPFSLPGANIGLCAPGAEIATTELGNEYSLVDGTSASTAIVSGAVALIRERFPSLSAAQTIHRLTATATDIGPPGRDEQCGYGVLNIVKALTADVPPLSGGGSSGVGASSGAAAGGSGGRGMGTGILGGIAAVLAGGVVFAGIAVRRRNRKRV